MVVYQCEDSLESIFTAVYRACEEKRDHDSTRISLTEEPLLFAEPVPVKAEGEKAARVIRTLKRRFGEADYRTICLALASPEPEKAQAVYRTVLKGIRGNCAPGHLFDRLADDDIRHVFSLARGAGNECRHLRGFLRFRELAKGILFSEAAPKNNVLTFLMPHFADRLPMENFMVYDGHRDFFAVHPAGREWYLVRGGEIAEEAARPEGRAGAGTARPGEGPAERSVRSEEAPGAGTVRPEGSPSLWALSEEEKRYRELFCRFCRSIAVKERSNPALQRSLLPLRFREYMTEFQAAQRPG
ncbi:MAG: TIGR03915 family putative DNA repair protein [Clostridium sp.]|jgi:probable DNA metabolism protein|nr:TIGR03915 family putative DNA repair protein [Clostridium sp.]